MGDTRAFPVTLIDPETGIKAVVDIDDFTGFFILDLNGQAFEALVYLDPSFSKCVFTSVRLKNL